MKKTSAVILIFIFTMLTLTACNTDNLQQYKKAFEKTEQIKKGQTSCEISVNLDFDNDALSDLSAEDLSKLSNFKDINGSFNVAFDKEAENMELRNYFNFGGLGYDFDMFFKGGEGVIKLPFVGKYVRIGEMHQIDEEIEGFDGIISNDTLKQISEIWVSLMKEDDVFKGKNIIITTPDGDVKAAEYTIKLSDEQIREMILKSIDIISGDHKLRDFFNENMIIKYDDDNSDITFDKLLQGIKESINKFKAENFTYTALVDIDGYIVNENLTYSFIFRDDDIFIKRIDYNQDIKNWDINREQNFNFPVLTEENTINTENENNMQNFIKDLFKGE